MNFPGSPNLNRLLCAGLVPLVLLLLAAVACSVDQQHDHKAAVAGGGTGGLGGSHCQNGCASGAGGASSGGDSRVSTTAQATSPSSQTTSTGGGSLIEPPLGGSSLGSGGPNGLQGVDRQAGTVLYRLIVPNVPLTPSPLLIVYSGVEGGQTMTQNLIGTQQITATSNFIRAVLDGVTYYNNGQAGAQVLDALRQAYDIDNDRSYLLGESAGTSAALQLGFDLRQSYFAAYWANDINATLAPSKTASELGFAPWGQVGPGGQFAAAQQIVADMKAAGYRTPPQAPYAGTGANQHGSVDQFLAALSWFKGKSRQ